MADTQLLPCPFCGGSDAFVERLDYTAAYVQCDADIGDGCSCQARGPIAVQDDDGEEIPGGAGAIAAWNRRAALASRPAEVDDEGKADAKRLDWLESANLTFCGNYSNTGFRAIGSSMWHGTLREAIDGAMFEAGAAPSCTTSAGGT